MIRVVRKALHDLITYHPQVEELANVWIRMGILKVRVFRCCSTWDRSSFAVVSSFLIHIYHDDQQKDYVLLTSTTTKSLQPLIKTAFSCLYQALKFYTLTVVFDARWSRLMMGTTRTTPLQLPSWTPCLTPSLLWIRWQPFVFKALSIVGLYPEHNKVFDRPAFSSVLNNAEDL